MSKSKKSDKKPGSFEVVLKFSPMEGLGGGFRQEWVSGKGGGVEFALDSGAGVGNPLLTFWIKKPGGKADWYTASAPELCRAILAKLNPEAA